MARRQRLDPSTLSVAYATNAGNATTLGGKSLKSLMDNPTTSADITSKGWYKIAEMDYPNSSNHSGILVLQQAYSSERGDSYVLAITSGSYKDTASITQLAGVNYKTITNVRVVKGTDGSIFIEMYYNLTTTNRVYVKTLGTITSVTPTASPGGTVLASLTTGNGLIQLQSA